MNISYLLMFAVTFSVNSGVVEGLHCYSCNSLVEGEDCLIPNLNTTINQCAPNEQFCRKKIVESNGMLVTERACYITCAQQEGVIMMQQVRIDMWCCTSDLCNAANTASILPYLYAVILTVLIKLS